MWRLIIMFVVGYLIGSINLSIVVTKFVGKIDIRKVGSGNVGGTNVARAMGAGWGVFVIVCEMLKSISVGMIGRFVFPGDIFGFGDVGGKISGLIVMCGVLLGNVLPCFHKFKGGKGVSVCGAAMAVVDWRAFVVIISVFLIVFLISHMVSLGSILASLSAPITVCVLYINKSQYWPILCLITTVMISVLIFRHKDNISRIFKGTENKFKF